MPDRAVEKPVDAMVRQAMDDHLRSLVAGRPERVADDFAPELRGRQADRGPLVPDGLRSYTVIGEEVDGSLSRISVRLEGTSVIESIWTWSSLDGRFRITDVRRLNG